MTSYLQISMIRRLCAVLSIPLLLAGAACNEPGDSAEEPGGDPSPSPSSEQPTEPEQLIYVDGTTLKSFSLADLEDGEIRSLPSADIDLAPDGRRYAVVRETASGEPDPDAFRQPEIVVGSLDGGRATRLGPGRSPMWSPDSSLIAAPVPAGARVECPAGLEGDAEGMCSPEKVVAYDPESGPPGTNLLGTEPRWFLLGWSDNQVVGIDARGEMAAAAPGEDPLSFIGLSSTEVWDVSPTERRFVTVIGTSDAQVTDFDAQILHKIDLEGARLGAGEWSPDGSRVAAVFLNTSETPMVARLGVIDASSGAVEFVPGEVTAQGQVVWGVDGSFAYVGTDTNDPGLLQAILCSPELDCEPLFAWTEGIRLLGLV